jgi:hypothetical protein
LPVPAVSSPAARPCHHHQPPPATAATTASDASAATVFPLPAPLPGLPGALGAGAGDGAFLLPTLPGLPMTVAASALALLLLLRAPEGGCVRGVGAMLWPTSRSSAARSSAIDCGRCSGRTPRPASMACSRRGL